MGRGRVVLERIESKINRQVSFSKRRNGLLKKACELSVLCEAEVGVIIFSGRGKLYEFGNPELSLTLERYRQFRYSSQDNILDADEAQNLLREIPKLKMKYESLQRSERHFLGEDLNELGIKDLESLEKRLDATLSLARERMSQKMTERFEELRKKEREQQEMYQQLKSKLEKEERKQRRMVTHGQVDNNNMEMNESNGLESHVDDDPSQRIITEIGCSSTMQNPEDIAIDQHEAVLYDDHRHENSHINQYWLL